MWRGFQHGVLMGGGVAGLLMLVVAPLAVTTFGTVYLAFCGVVLSVIGSPASGRRT